MDVAHAFEHGLFGLSILPPTESRIGLGKLSKDRAHFGAIRLGSRMKRDGVNWIRIGGLAELERLVFGRNRVASLGIRKLGNSTYIACVQDRQRNLLFAA